MNIDNWVDDFPRLAELKHYAESVHRGHYFQHLPDVLLNPMAHSYFSTFESDLAALNDDAYQAIKSEVRVRIPTSADKEARRAFASLLNEVKAFVFLRNEGFTNVSFIPRSPSMKKVTPDVQATLNGTVLALVEVKSVWESDYQSDWIQQNTLKMKQHKPATGRRLVPSFPDGLKNKLSSDLQKATSQLRAYSAPTECRRVVYFVIFLDIEQQNTPNITMQIENYLVSLIAIEDINIECDFQNAFE